MATAQTYKRAADYVVGIGDNLDRIAGHDVLLVDYQIGDRNMRGETRKFVSLDIATVSDPANVQRFHAWSDSLGEKLVDVPQDALPVLIKFVRVPTAGGYKVWSFE